MSVIDEKHCTGCTACMNACPVGAIKFEENDKGFLYPVIDDKICIHCMKCKNICPAIKKDKEENVRNCYAGWILDDNKRMESSSGGLFTAIAQFVFEQNGFVCGVRINSNHEVEHIIIDNEKQLNELRGSKYVQSNLKKVFLDLKKLLDEDKFVLFSGTPCQVAGLKSFLDKDYDKLITVDIVCHGVPSPKIFKEYIEQVEKENNKKISDISFRNKSEGWRNPQFVLKSNESIIEKTEVYNDIFGRSFLTNMILRDSCYNCNFSPIRSNSDVTLGDFWGGWLHKKEFDDKKGVSLIITHTDFGEKIINELIREKIMLHKDIPLKLAINNNYPIALPAPKHVNNYEFFEDYKNGHDNIKGKLYKYLDDSHKGIKYAKSVGILNFHYENYNFGANLVAYSLMRNVEKLGYNAKIINYNPFEELLPTDKITNINFEVFRNNFLKMTHKFSIDDELYKLNNYFDTFVVGSDQVWRKTITGRNMTHYFLDFVGPTKKKISYAASFGTDSWEGDAEETKQVEELLNKFEHISVREKSGINICEETFNVKASQVLDPTLLLTVDDYQEIIDSEVHENIDGDYAAYYFLFDSDRSDKSNAYLKNILDAEKLKIINIKGKDKQVLGKESFVYNSISDWINYIKNSKIVITDSYHGVLFSIIYNKPFICILKNCKSLSRFETLFDFLDIKANFFQDFQDIKNVSQIYNIDYSKINKALNEQKEISINFLRNALEEKTKVYKENEVLNEWIKEKEVISSQKERISNLEIYYVELNEKYSKKCEEKDLLEEQNRKLTNELLEERKKLNDILNSTSWKISKPIRSIKNIIKKLK